MFAVSGLHHYWVPGMPLAHSGNSSLQIYNISNSSDEYIKQVFADPHSRYTTQEEDEVHRMAYTRRVKRAEKKASYSAAECQNASEELSQRVNAVVYHPTSWSNNKSRIEYLQNITKSADCRAKK